MVLKLVSSTDPPAVEESAGEAGPKILAVDDDPNNLIAIQAILAELGQNVVCASSGEEALRRLLKEEFAVILLDVLMPGMDGYETAAIIRARERTRHVPIIFLSAINKDSSDLARAYAAGAVDFVFKPVEPLILRSKVAVFIELRKREQEIRRQAELEKRLLADNLLVRTEQLRTEAALERSLAQQSLVIEALPLALYVARPSDNLRVRNLIGGRLESVIGAGNSDPPENWIDRVHPDDRPSLRDALRAANSTRVFSADYRFLCADGKYRWLSDRAAFGRGGAHEQLGILLDISDRRLLEEQLVHAHKIEAIGQMTGGIAHDFNNMLSVVIGSLDRALSLPIESEKLRSRIDLAMQAAVSCADLTKRLLTFARRQSLEPKILRLCEELSKLTEMFARLLNESISVEVDCGEDIWPVYLDGSQFEAAIVNLVINARDAMARGGSIRIGAENRPAADPALSGLGLVRADYVELFVSDTGAGMSEEVRSRAFEPFFTTKEAGKGTGLGLSSIYGFISQSGGTVVIDSEVGRGTIVRLFLPRAAALGAPAESGAAETQRAAGVSFTGATVLLVEDEDRVRSMAASMLEELGCNVVTAESGDEALSIVEGGQEISALFTDCLMPGRLDGANLALTMRRRMPHLPVLFTSGYRGGVNTLNLDDAGTAFLPKPYSSAQLADHLAAIGVGRRA